MIPFNVLIFDEENGTHKTDKCWDNNNIVHCIILSRSLITQNGLVRVCTGKVQPCKI